MELVGIVTGLALVEYFVFLLQCGQARGRLGVAAPAMSGNPEFERYLRVQYNTIEQLVIFLPSIWLFAAYVSPGVAALLGLLFIVGRFLYARGYIADPARRGPGFGITLLANGCLLVGGMAGALVRWLG
jgi:glutathione S-transferase